MPWPAICQHPATLQTIRTACQVAAQAALPQGRVGSYQPRVKRFADALAMALVRHHAQPLASWGQTWRFELYATPSWNAVANPRTLSRPVGVHDWEDGNDLTVMMRAGPGQGRIPLLRMESEAANWWQVGDDLEDPDTTGNHNDFAWDFWSMLRAQAPVRVFVCRVGRRDNGSGQQRRGQLEATVQAILSRHSHHLQPTDRTYIVILSSDVPVHQDSRLMIGNGAQFMGFHPW